MTGSRADARPRHHAGDAGHAAYGYMRNADGNEVVCEGE